jgi:hypothetical protein
MPRVDRLQLADLEAKIDTLRRRFEENDTLLCVETVNKWRCEEGKEEGKDNSVIVDNLVACPR